jgi:hypothetical protein
VLAKAISDAIEFRNRSSELRGLNPEVVAGWLEEGKEGQFLEYFQFQYRGRKEPG